MEYEPVSGNYLAAHQLKKGAAGWVLLPLSHIVLRRLEPDLERPYPTPGGSLTSGVAFVLSIVAFVSTFLASLEAAIWSAVFSLIMVAYFFLYSRHHLVANAPEEEFEAIVLAERALG